MATIVVNPSAERLLSRSAEGRCHSVFASAAHLQLGDRLLLVAPEGSRPARDCPFGMSLPTEQWQRIRAEFELGAAAVWSVHTGELALTTRDGTQHRLDLSGAERSPGWAWEVGTLPTYDGAARRQLSRRLAPIGLLNDQTPHEVSSRLTKATRAVLGTAPAAELGWLVGRGPGLTPSGDDVVVGLVAAATARGMLDPAAREWLSLTYADRRITTDVAREYVRCALEGTFARSVVAVLAALGRSDAALTAATSELLAHGHTSGADLLMGLYQGLTATTCNDPQILLPGR